MRLSPRSGIAGLATTVVVVGLAQVVAPTGAATGAPPPAAAARAGQHTANPVLGNGLGRLLDQRKSGSAVGPGGFKVDQSSLAIRDDQGRVLIDLTPQAGVDADAFRQAAEKLGFDLQNTDTASGLMQGFAPLSKVEALAALPGTGTIAQTLKPIAHVGATTSQGVEFQRVDQVLDQGVSGQGITVGVLSDSYDTATEAITGGPIATHADDDIATGDLPGADNPDGNTDPVVVLEDYDDETATDEGRGMLQIVHDVAPDARLCFATAFGGDVGFANNIRALADPNGQCHADVIVDDVSYFNEPFFSDGIIGDAVDDVEAQGVSYFSSAGNAGDQNAWRAPVKLVAPGKVKAAAKQAGLDFSDVDPSLYAGGVQDMSPGNGVDIGQTISVDDAGGLYDLQWSDPVDLDGPTLGEPYFEDSGELTQSQPEETFTYTATQDQVGQKTLFRTDAIPSGTTDLVLDVTTPDGTELGPVDTGASPEVLPVTIEEAGDYTITVSGFQGSVGDFTVDVSPITEPSTVSTDFNVLVFNKRGKFLAPLGDDNTLTGRPSEVLSIPGVGDDLQFVIVDSTEGPTDVAEIGYINNGGLYTKEYFNPLAPATFGHSTAAGASGVAAVDPFKPYVPEYYTSPGGDLNFYYDSQGNPFTTPEVRQKPDLSSTDRGNTTFFVADDLRDDDTFPNFGGTSAAAPHAAGIAALMLSAPDGDLSPTEVRDRMQSTAFDHDLDPFEASGKKGGLELTAAGAPGDERDATPASMDDPGFFTLTYDGKRPLKAVTLYAETASPTALGKDADSPSAGLVWDPRKLAAPGSYRNGGFPFTIGGTSGGLKKGSVSATFSSPVGDAPWYRHLRVRFGDGLRQGQTLKFGVDRDIRFPGLAPTPVEGNGADEMGGGVLLPQGETLPDGLKFVGVRANGKKITGYVRNDIGHGFSALDGWGVVDAYAAVFGD